MSLMKICTFLFSITLLSFSSGLAQEKAAEKTGKEETVIDVTIGASIFKSKCAFCHGDNGDGQGPSGKFLKPPPGDFTDSEWIHGGDMDSIVKTITEGVEGTAMVGFANALTDEEIKSVAAFVQQFSKPSGESAEKEAGQK